MVAHRPSLDLKARVPKLRARGWKVPAICDVLGLRRTCVYNVLHYHRTYGVPANLAARKAGRPRTFNGIQLAAFKDLQSQHPTAYQDELARMALALGVKATQPTISRTLGRLRHTRRKIALQAREADPLLQAVFMNRIGRLVSDPYQLMFIDESSKDERTLIRRHCYGPAGQRIHVSGPFVRGTRYSVLPVLTLDGMIAYKVVEGSVKAEEFVEFLREHVVRTLFSFSLMRSEANHALDALYYPLSRPSQHPRAR
jgi:hypothetical protein